MSTPITGNDQKHIDLDGLNLISRDDDGPQVVDEPPKMNFAREKLLEEAKQMLDAQTRKGVSLVVIGTV